MIEVRTVSRLHLGFHNIYDGLRAYGGIGVALEEPRWIIRMDWGDGPRPREAEFVAERLGVKKPFHVEVLEAVPRHVGYGSTTQMLMALATGLNAMLGLGLSPRELAYLVGVGWVSGVGLHVFEHGGFVIDSGRRAPRGALEPPRGAEDLPKLLLRVDVPPHWRFVTFTPPGRGKTEAEEEGLMTVDGGQGVSKELRRLCFREMVPALVFGDIRGFGRALTRLQILVGSYFSGEQGGTYCCPLAEEINRAMARCGCHGSGQSSWGPTQYCVSTAGEADGVRRCVEERTGVRGYVRRPSNRGALMVVR